MNPGGSIYRKDKEGKTALQYAKEKRFDTELLEAAKQSPSYNDPPKHSLIYTYTLPLLIIGASVFAIGAMVLGRRRLSLG